MGDFFSEKTKAKDFLAEYATVFDSVEGNNTFYGVPRPDTIQQWADATPEHFRFCFKFPKSITHSQQLQNADDATLFFLKALAPIQHKMGLLSLQLPPYFDGSQLKVLETFLKKLPEEFTYAVEVRHSDYFDNGVHENRLNELLGQYAVNRVMFDTGVLHGLEPGNEPSVSVAQSKKPKVPERFMVTAKNPFLRFVGGNHLADNRQRFDELAGVVGGWMKKGLRPFVFIHSPDKYYAPFLCRDFHQLLQKRHQEAGDFPPWPCERSEDSGQMTLFDF